MLRALSYVLVSLLLLFPASADAMPATYYGMGDGYAGQVTASGDICCGYNVASPYLPFGTVLTVCYKGCVDVTVNDRCACSLDLGYPAAQAIGLDEVGVADVAVY